MLTTSPVLGYPLDQGDMILDTDASDVGIGVVLSQAQQRTEHVLAYGSRKLTKTEQNYCTTLTRRKEPEGQLARWQERLGEYDFENFYRAGQLHHNARPVKETLCPVLPVQAAKCTPCSEDIGPQLMRCQQDTAVGQVMLSAVGVDE